MPRPYDIDFRPYFDVGETAHLQVGGGGKDVRIVHVEQLGEITIDYGAVTTTEVIEQVSDNLKVQKGQLAQWRFRIDDASVSVNFNLQAANQIGRTRDVRTRILSHMAVPEFVRPYMWLASEHFVYEDEAPVFNLVQDQSNDQINSQGYLRFNGWRFDFEELEKGLRGVSTLFVNGGSRR